MKPNDTEVNLTDEMLQAYMDASAHATPDLWSRIEEGFDKEITAMQENVTTKDGLTEHDNQTQTADIVAFPKKKMAVRIITSLAAIALLCLIAVPIMKGMVKTKDSQSDDSCERNEMMIAAPAEESMEDIKEDAAEAGGASLMDTENAGSQSVGDSEMNSISISSDVHNISMTGYICRDEEGVYYFLTESASGDSPETAFQRGEWITLSDSDKAVEDCISGAEPIAGELPTGARPDCTCYGPFQVVIAVDVNGTQTMSGKVGVLLESESLEKK